MVMNMGSIHTQDIHTWVHIYTWLCTWVVYILLIPDYVYYPCDKMKLSIKIYKIKNHEITIKNHEPHNQKP